ncbi:glycosyltransferase family 4 protein [Ideonella sp. 4Y11]|uniref:Glycosyltransferase family 4 protein n=1 Tax=Ideonella aquatica TaxID=2824119 RepID=A0A940YIB8_9BURK|nr:glycosyltransferase family 4 protein [Ideonella aquatica]
MEILLTSFTAAWVLTLIAVRSSRHFAHLSHDNDLSGPQKIHATPVPRIGGMGIFGGVLAGVILIDAREGPGLSFGTLLMLAAVPAFAAGFIEDLLKSVSPARRLLATAASAALAAWLVDALVRRTDIPGLDWVAASTVGALVLTIPAVAGIANAVNIIDGFNGLASMCSMLMLAAIAYVAFQVGDSALVTLALAGIGAIMGFFLWNYPAGQIFLGDGGAYFLGFLVAELGVLLIARNPQVSPLFPLVVCVYPVFETLFSIYRRVVVRGHHASHPDGVHLHSLVFKRLMRWAVGSEDPRQRTRRNSLTSPYLWVLCSLPLAPAMLSWHSSAIQAALLVTFALIYVTLYSRIVSFRTPRWLIFRR